MIAHLYELFPEGISDETAFHLVEFFMSLASELDVHYFAQTKRYLDENQCVDLPEYLQNKNPADIDDNF